MIDWVHHDSVTTVNPPLPFEVYLKSIKQPSNADRIRAMSDEELAEWIESIVYCRSCPFHGKQCDGEAFVSRASCKLHWLDWLKKEADNANPR